MGTRTRPTLTFLLLLLLVSVAQAARPRFRRQSHESPSLLSKVQDQIFSYWESAKSRAQQFYETVQIPKVNENLRHVYDKSTEVMTTYTGILTDQIFHMLKGEH